MRNIKKPKEFGEVSNVKSTSSSSKPLVVPLTTSTGEVIFRMAPLRTADAWIHPGIARFNFMERAVRKAKIQVDKIMTEYCGNVISAGIAEVFND